MPIRVAILWHMHQPFYKDLVTGEYRMPWVRLHALKDYFGMVNLLEEFPTVHQTFNLVPSLMEQLQDYTAGAVDNHFALAAKPAPELTQEERRLALQQLFQANATHMIGTYPRYAELMDQYRSSGGDPVKAEPNFSEQDFTDLQVVSQLAWFDQFFLEEPEVAKLVAKQRDYDAADQKFVMEIQKPLIARVLPAYKSAAERGAIEISTSPFYHPILPLLCDSDIGAIASPGLELPERFQHPEDAREQLRRGLELHQRTFGSRPSGVWPSEGSVSEEVLAIAHALGVQWMASDEGVLGRSLGRSFIRDGQGTLVNGGAEQLYRAYRYENNDAEMHLFFRDHALSDLIGFVYSGMDAAEAANHLMQRICENARPVLERGFVPIVPIILDGENAWEAYPRSGREFLRRWYAAMASDPQFEVVTVSEAIARTRDFATLRSLAPGSWINANFNVWIGSPEDNRSWDHLHDAREFFTESGAAASADERAVACEEFMIAEGSDWNWWYGPEHHSVNDAEFDALYRKHLSNVYTALGATPPEALAHPIAHGAARPYFVPQTGFIHPRIEGDGRSRYFDWVGAAVYSADRTGAAMHGQQFYLEAIHAGIDEQNLYVRLDFLRGSVPPEHDLELRIAIEALRPGELEITRSSQLHIQIERGAVAGFRLEPAGSETRRDSTNGGECNACLLSPDRVAVCAVNDVDAKIPLALLQAEQGGKLRLRVSLWSNRLPLDALPLEGSLELDVISEHDLSATGY
jgi:alpha-amylase/alpha-mannosidase (GH57 family)